MIENKHYQDLFIARLLAGGATPENQMALSMVAQGDFSGVNHVIYNKAASIMARCGRVDLEVVLPELDSAEALIAVRLVKDWGGSSSALSAAEVIVKINRLNAARARLELLAQGITSVHCVDDLVSELSAISSELSADVSQQMPKIIGDIMPEFIDDLEQVHSGAKETGIKIGIDAIDSHIGNILMTDIVVIGGAPGWGKTEFGLKCLSSISLTHNRPVLAFTMEMSELEITQRFVAIEGDISGGKMRDPRGMAECDWTGLTNGIGRLKDAKIYIDDKADISVDEIISKAKLWKARHPDIAAIMIDYIQNAVLPAGNTRVEQINEASRRLKSLAKEINCPIFLVSQMNREWSKRGSKEPTNQDLAEGSGLERDASIILFPYRETEAGVTDGNSDLAKIITGKNRSNQKQNWVMEWRNGHFYETGRQWSDNSQQQNSQKPSYI